MTDTYPHKSQSPGGNHPRTSTLGGASAVPTAANNSGGGTGWGDKGFFKGGSHESGHTNVFFYSSPYTLYTHGNVERKPKRDKD